MELLYVFLSLLAVHYIYFIGRVYAGLKRIELPESTGRQEKLSVLIPLRNESRNVEELCNSLKSQTLEIEKYEVLFIDDSSTDNTIDILKNNMPANSRIIYVSNSISEKARKKKALIEGIKQAANPIIVVTDADCTQGSDWLKAISKYFDEDTGIVAGPVDNLPGGNFLSKFQRLEFAGLILTGAGLISAGSPAICSAANLAYRKKAFEEVGGFESQLDFTSGDDDLFLQQVAVKTNYKIKFAYTKEAMVKTKPKKSVSDFLMQRKRWASKFLFYSNKLLVLKIILLALFYIALPIQFLGGFIWEPALFVTFFLSLIFKMIVEYLVLNFGARSLYDKEMLSVFLAAELIQIPYIIISAIGGMFGNFHWKGTRVKR